MTAPIRSLLSCISCAGAPHTSEASDWQRLSPESLGKCLGLPTAKTGIIHIKHGCATYIAFVSMPGTAGDSETSRESHSKTLTGRLLYFFKRGDEKERTVQSYEMACWYPYPDVEGLLLVWSTLAHRLRRQAQLYRARHQLAY
jgi:hypothetical protein